jgi:hypothetical protein
MHGDRSRGIPVHNLKIVLRVIFCTVLIVSGISTALAEYEPKDNYSSLLLSCRSSVFANHVRSGSECHSGLAGLGYCYPVF